MLLVSSQFKLKRKFDRAVGQNLERVFKVFKVGILTSKNWILRIIVKMQIDFITSTTTFGIKGQTACSASVFSLLCGFLIKWNENTYA